MRLKAFVCADGKNPIIRLVFSERPGGEYGGDGLMSALAKVAHDFLGGEIAYQWSKDRMAALVIPGDSSTSESQLNKCVRHIAFMVGIPRDQITFTRDYACR